MGARGSGLAGGAVVRLSVEMVEDRTVEAVENRSEGAGDDGLAGLDSDRGLVTTGFFVTVGAASSEVVIAGVLVEVAFATLDLDAMVTTEAVLAFEAEAATFEVATAALLAEVDRGRLESAVVLTGETVLETSSVVERDLPCALVCSLALAALDFACRSSG